MFTGRREEELMHAVVLSAQVFSHSEGRDVYVYLKLAGEIIHSVNIDNTLPIFFSPCPFAILTPSLITQS